MIESKFKNTEIGLIPEDWEVKTIGEVAETSSGGTPSTSNSDNYNGDIKWFTTTELKDCYLYDSIQHITKKGLNTSSAKLFPEGTLLLAMYGATIGKLGILKCTASTNQACCAIFCNNLDTNFLFYALLKRRSNLISLGSGAGQPNISQSIVQQFLIPLPPLSEQRRIAEVLSQADELIKQWENVIAKKRDIKTATMQLLLTGKKRLSGFKDEWVEKKLGEVGFFVAGNGFPIEYQGEKNAKYPFYKVSDFNNENNDNYLDIANNYISDETAKKLHCSIIPKGAIVFAKIGAAIFLERKRIVVKDCCIDNNMQSFQLYEGNDNHYILYVLKTISFGSLVSASALPALKVVDLNNIPVLLPSDLAEQRAIAEILSDMDEEIKTLEAKVEKLRNIKSGMMQQLLSGKIRLKGEEGDNVRQFVENNFGQMPYAAEDEAEFGR